MNNTNIFIENLLALNLKKHWKVILKIIKQAFVTMFE